MVGPSRIVGFLSRNCIYGSFSRRMQSYQQEASHTLQALQSVLSPETSLYKDGEVRDMLAKSPGGSITLDLNDETGIATLTLKNSSKKNAITGTMMLELSDCITKLEGWTKGLGVILTGADGEFCTGGDFEFVKSIADPVSGAKMSIFMQTLLAKFHTLPIMSTAYIQGHAYGGGAELATACDFRLIHPKAKIGFVQARLGILPGWGGGTHLTRIVGPREALFLLASGRVLNGSEALSIGLADAFVTSDEELNEWWDQFKNSSKGAIRGAKRVVQNAEECQYMESLNRERDIFTSLWGAKDHLRALEQIVKNVGKNKK